MNRTAAQAGHPSRTLAPKTMLEFFEPLRGTEMHLAENRSFRDRRTDQLMEALVEWDDELPRG